MWNEAPFQSVGLIGFIAGLGLFLFGMLQLENAIRTLSSHSFRRFLRRTTSNPLTSMLSGTVITMVVQSSSMVGLMVLALVGAGVIPLFNAIGVVMGSNLGTTFTGWIVTTIGFKLNLSALAVPLMGLGALVAVALNKREHGKSWGLLAFGLGLLLFGLDGMKSSIEQLAQQVDLQMLKGYPLIVYMGFGVVFTALIQSSSATMMITLSALHAGIVDLPAAAALVIGADMGTTSTMALGSFQGSRIKKQVALAQIIFNLVTDLIALMLLRQILWVVENQLQITDPLYSLVAFHSLFNLLGIALFTPFLKAFSRKIESFFKTDDEDVREYINNVPVTMVDEAMLAIKKESHRLILQSLELNLRNLKLEPASMRMPQRILDGLQDVFPSRFSFNERYEAIKKLEGEILEYAGDLQKNELTPMQGNYLHNLLSSVRHAVYAVKSLKDVRENFMSFRHAENALLRDFIQRLISPERHFYSDFCGLFVAEHEPAFVDEEVERLIEENRTLHKQFESDLFKRGLLEGIDETEASTLLNVNRELRASNHNLLKALQLRMP